MTDEPQTSQEYFIIETKELRVELDALLQRMKSSPRKSRSRSLAITHLEDSIMRLGMDLKEQKEEGANLPNPYPNSYNPTNTKIDPTADGIKL